MLARKVLASGLCIQLGPQGRAVAATRLLQVAPGQFGRTSGSRVGPDDTEPPSSDLGPSDGIAAYLRDVRAGGVTLASPEEQAETASGVLPRNATAESSQPTRTLVVAKYDENVQWLQNLPKNVEALVYQSQDQSGDHFVENVGNEAAKYLTYIVENYDHLPNSVAFVQAGRQDWHDPFPKDVTLRAWPWGSAEEHGGIAFLPTAAPCLVEDSVVLPPHSPPPVPPGEKCVMVVEHSPKQMSTIRDVWGSVFEPQLGPLPQRWLTRCCAQFEVTKEAIRQHPVDFYRALLEWAKRHDKELMASDYAGDMARNHDPERRDAGHVLEPVWVLLFSLPGRHATLPVWSTPGTATTADSAG